MSGPLASLKVLDFSTLLPGPFATLLLADMGEPVEAHRLVLGAFERVSSILGRAHPLLEPYVRTLKRVAGLLGLKEEEAALSVQLMRLSDIPKDHSESDPVKSHEIRSSFEPSRPSPIDENDPQRRCRCSIM